MLLSWILAHFQKLGISRRRQKEFKRLNYNATSFVQYMWIIYLKTQLLVYGSFMEELMPILI